MENRTYRIIRNHRDTDGQWDVVVQSGLDWNTADAKRNELSRAEMALHPTKTSWTRDLFIVEMEKAPAPVSVGRPADPRQLSLFPEVTQ